MVGQMTKVFQRNKTDWKYTKIHRKCAGTNWRNFCHAQQDL